MAGPLAAAAALAPIITIGPVTADAVPLIISPVLPRTLLRFLGFTESSPASARLRLIASSAVHSSWNSSNSIRPLWSLSYFTSSSFALPESISSFTVSRALRSSL